MTGSKEKIKSEKQPQTLEHRVGSLCRTGYTCCLNG